MRLSQELLLEIQMSRDQSSFAGEEQPVGNEQLVKIASKVGAKNFFLGEQARNLDEWAENANEIFRNTADVMTLEYELKASNLLDQYNGSYDDSYSRSRKQFDAFCILNRKVQKKNDEIENLAAHISQKNTKKSFFGGWRAHTKKMARLRQMEEKSQKYYEKRCMKTVLKSWLFITMENTKTKIKNDVLEKTEIEVSRIQTEYERLIRSLEETLEKKLNELRKEEEEHKQLHDKYENMYRRASVEQQASSRS